MNEFAPESSLIREPSSISTDRLILRPWKKEDFKPFADINADSRVREFFPSTQTKPESDVHAEAISEGIEKYGWGFWAVSTSDSDFIGMIGLSQVRFSSHFTPAVEIGWRLGFEHWGKGYATEGAKAALAYGFEELKLKEIVAFTTPDNLRSRKIMEKLGMTHDPIDDFDHPMLPKDHKMRRHVLYRIQCEGRYE